MIYFGIVTSGTAFIIGFCKGQGMQCVIGGPPPQCCGYLNCSPTQTRPSGFVGGYGVCSRGIQMQSASAITAHQHLISYYDA